MKQQTHPKLSTTIVQMTDGSFFIKKWLFFREFLSLEVDVKSHSGWLETVKNTTIKQSKVKK